MIPTSRHRPRAAFIRLLHKHTTLVVSAMFALGFGATVWHLSRLPTQLVESAALNHAALYAQALAEFRTIYTSEVVARVKPQGIKVTHDYETTDGAIPLPTTLSMKLGQNIGEHESGAQTRLYSPYPFPWRKATGGLQDEFASAAWEHLTARPDEPYYRFVDFEGRWSFRYATADLMRPSCVNCHNTHPDTPKRDWQVGDLRGILEIIHPLNQVIERTNAGLAGTSVLLVMMALLGVLGLTLTVGRLRRTSAELEERVKERTAALRRSEARTRAILETASDSIITIDQWGIIESFNAAAEITFRYTADEVIGRNVSMLVPEPHQERHDEYLQHYLQTGQRKVIGIGREVVGLRKDGTTFPMDLSVSEARQGSRRIFCGIARDITERKRTENTLHGAKAYAEHAAHELEEKVNELEEFNRLVVGRELRMIELKREVNELAQQLGAPQPHDLSFENAENGTRDP